MVKETIWKRSLLDISAAFFLIGGVISLITFITMTPIATVYPFRLKSAISFTYLIIFIVGIICAIESFECFNFASKRMIVKAGIRGIVVGAILLSIGVIAGSELAIGSSFIGGHVWSQLIIGSAILILIGGIINYIYRE